MNRKIKQALNAIGMAQVPLLTLEELGENIQPQTSAFLIRYSVEGITGLIRAQYAEAEKSIPAKHAALSLLNKSRKALDALDRAVELVNQSEHGDEKSLPQSDRDVTARIILAFTAEAGRWMEQAEESLGEDNNYGWLQGQGVAGLPGDHMRADVQQQWVAREFAKLDQSHRGQIAQMIAGLVNAKNIADFRK